MNFYLRAGCMNDDVILVSDGEESSNYSLRFEELKGFKNSSNSSKGLVQKIDSDYYIEGVSQVFVHLCGTTISHQENLYTSNVNMLMKAACDKVGVKSKDFYSIYCGKVLDPEQLLSYYQINKDSKIIINARLRDGCAGHNWDYVISDLDPYQRVPLPGDLLLPEQAIIQPQMEVKYLARLLRVRCRKVLIYLCRKHFSGHSFGGNFSSQQIMFDSDGNVRIDAAPEEYSRPSALLDYNAVSGIFDRALGGDATDKYPMHFYHLIDFLSARGPNVDCQSKAVIAFLTNHISLLTYSERINHSAFLDLLIKRLGEDDLTALIKALVNFDWELMVRQIPAMNQTYTYIWWEDDGGNIRYPYKNNAVSLLVFSHNFFKHRLGFPLNKLEAAFSLVMADQNFLAHMLFKILVRFKSSQQPCPASVETFVDEVIQM
ncbi:hypothetical protein ACQJBY_020017 [Aegilops geniculata]